MLKLNQKEKKKYNTRLNDHMEMSYSMQHVSNALQEMFKEIVASISSKPEYCEHPLLSEMEAKSLQTLDVVWVQCMDIKDPLTLLTNIATLEYTELSAKHQIDVDKELEEKEKSSGTEVPVQVTNECFDSSFYNNYHISSGGSGYVEPEDSRFAEMKDHMAAIKKELVMIRQLLNETLADRREDLEVVPSKEDSLSAYERAMGILK